MIIYEQFILKLIFQTSLFIKKTNAKNYSLIIFYFLLLLFSLYLQTELFEKKTIYGYILYM